MKTSNWIVLCLLGGLALTGSSALAQDRDHRDHDRDDHPSFQDHDRDEMRGWYKEHEHHPPKGFRDHDRLSPELEHRLVAHEVLAPELRSHVVVVPADLYRRLPAPPRGCKYVVIGGHVVLVDSRSWMVHDVFHFELNL